MSHVPRGKHNALRSEAARAIDSYRRAEAVSAGYLDVPHLGRVRDSAHPIPRG